MFLQQHITMLELGDTHGNASHTQLTHKLTVEVTTPPQTGRCCPPEAKDLYER